MKIFFLTLLLIVGAVCASAQDDMAKRSSSVVVISGDSYYVHTVSRGETLYSLSKLYDTTEDVIRAQNPHVTDVLKEGLVLKIPQIKETANKTVSDRKQNKLFDTHIVNKGETAYSIAKRYEIPIVTLMEDNEGFNPTILSVGQTLKIRVKSQGTVDVQHIEKEIDTYKEALNSVDDRFTHHVVQKGETLYSLSRSNNIPLDTIVKYNKEELKDGLKLGSILRLPVTVTAVVAPVALVANNNQVPVYQQQQSVNTVPLRLRHIDASRPINVIMMLPLKGEGVQGRQFLEFYQGALIALEELKKMGVNTNVDLFNTARTKSQVRDILETPELGRADIIIGPVYEDCFAEVADFAAKNGIVAVSPLAGMEQSYNSNVFQVAPDPSSKNAKLSEEFSAANNVIVISSTNNDANFEREITPLLPHSARRITASVSEIENALTSEKENVFVVLSSNENTVDNILATISSVQNNLTARSIKHPVIKVVGNREFAKFKNNDKNLYFKLNLRYITSYHADRGDERVADFDRRYISSFSSLPSLSSYRGYDVAKMFVGAIKMNGDQYADNINNSDLKLLQTPYRFEHSGGKRVNKDWAKVCYGSDYTITVK